MNQIGLVEVSAVEGTNDTATEAETLGASFSVDEVFNPESTLVPMNRAGGVTRTLIKPYNGNSLFAGLGSVMDLAGDYDSLIVSDVAVFAVYGEHAASMSGGSRQADKRQNHNQRLQPEYPALYRHQRSRGSSGHRGPPAWRHPRA